MLEPLILSMLILPYILLSIHSILDISRGIKEYGSVFELRTDISTATIIWIAVTILVLILVAVIALSILLISL